MKNNTIKLLYIDDEKENLTNFKFLFQDDYDIYTAISAAEGLELLSQYEFQVVIADQRMPDMTGIQVLSEIARRTPDTVRILLTAYTETQDLIDAINIGKVYQYITKPYQEQTVRTVLNNASENWRLKRDNQLLMMQLKEKNEEYETANEELRQSNDELKVAQERVEISEKNYKSLFQNMNSSASLYEVIYNEQGKPCDYRFLEVNTFYEKNIGFNATDVVGKTLLEIFPATEQEWLETFENVVLTSNPATIESYSKEVDKYFELIVYIPQKGKLALIGSDITNRKRTELELKEKSEEIDAQNEEYLQINEELYQSNEELEYSKVKAEESDRLKTAFLQNMSHEIRTPMNAIMGFSDLLFENYDNKPKVEHFTKIIKQRSSDLLDIINDILDIAKIESGQLPINIEVCNLNDLFEELYVFFTEYQNRLGKNHIHFTLEAQCRPSEIIIVVDKIKLKQILINLITNAFKFTDNGSIDAGCKIDDKQNLVFFVTDTGSGIPVEKQDHVFERFAQLEPGKNKAVSGTGLGLSIVKGLVQILGGEINLESETQKGSTFSFTIKHETIESLNEERMLQETQKAYSFPKKTVLIVEDDYYNAEYLKEILIKTGLDILQVTNGKDAIETTKTNQVDLILMDVRLPDMDGYEVTREIKKMKPETIIIAQTAYASNNEKQKALDAGCDDYISKPTKKDMLVAMMHRHFSKE